MIYKLLLWTFLFPNRSSIKEMSSTSDTTVLVSEQLVVASDPAPHVRLLSLNRPSKRNALSQDTIKALLAQLSTAGDDKAVRVAIIAGAGSFFSGNELFTFFVSVDNYLSALESIYQKLCTIKAINYLISAELDIDTYYNALQLEPI